MSKENGVNMRRFKLAVRAYRSVDKITAFADKLLPRTYELSGSAVITAKYVNKEAEIASIIIGDAHHPLQLEALMTPEKAADFRIGMRVAILKQKLRTPLFHSLVLWDSFYIGPADLNTGGKFDETKLISASLNRPSS